MSAGLPLPLSPDTRTATGRAPGAPPATTEVEEVVGALGRRTGAKTLPVTAAEELHRLPGDLADHHDPARHVALDTQLGFRPRPPHQRRPVGRPGDRAVE